MESCCVNVQKYLFYFPSPQTTSTALHFLLSAASIPSETQILREGLRTRRSPQILPQKYIGINASTFPNDAVPVPPPLLGIHGVLFEERFVHVSRENQGVEISIIAAETRDESSD